MVFATEFQCKLLLNRVQQEACRGEPIVVGQAFQVFVGGFFQCFFQVFVLHIVGKYTQREVFYDDRTVGHDVPFDFQCVGIVLRILLILGRIDEIARVVALHFKVGLLLFCRCQHLGIIVTGVTSNEHERQDCEATQERKLFFRCFHCLFEFKN